MRAMARGLTGVGDGTTCRTRLLMMERCRVRSNPKHVAQTKPSNSLVSRHPTTGCFLVTGGRGYQRAASNSPASVGSDLDRR